MANEPSGTPTASALDRARTKAYWRLLPLLFVCYVIAYVDRANVSIAKLTMTRDLPGFDNAVIGLGAGMFFLGYFLLEIPGTLIVERWSARKWISRIMVSWGIVAALTALVKTPEQFYGVRFFLGLAEAGFFPGIIVYLTHWFPSRDRAKALAYFLVATPFAQIFSPKISNALLKIGTDEVVNGVTVHHPELFGLEGWQCVYIFWGIPAVVLGVVVLFAMTDRPKDAKWLTTEERDALEAELERERVSRSQGKRMTVLEALRHPKVLLLALAYFCTVTGSYGIEFFLPSILKDWYGMSFNQLTWLVMLPPMLGLTGQLFVGWSSDRHKERRYHAVVPIIIGASAIGLAPFTRGELWLTVLCFMVAFAGFKSYMPAFWSLPSLFLTEAAAAGSIGLINSIGNLGGFLGPTVLGAVEKSTGSYAGGLWFLCASMLVSSGIIFFLGLGHREEVGK
ncbi:MAG: sugar phosphate permease [Limisphaerales bacterium]|nr:MAG: sugar phosphate permease [Limisphaerales bacterium]KAG0510654.1 MAG: sugar phosphate permease [Limisphaerales bacterium]TXT52550.1 MAG: sugar phosphate permease [Limisphaerales bacterium]